MPKIRLTIDVVVFDYGGVISKEKGTFVGWLTSWVPILRGMAHSEVDAAIEDGVFNSVIEPLTEQISEGLAAKGVNAVVRVHRG